MKTPLLTSAVVLFVGLINLPAAVLYVDLKCANPTPPYADWSTAATTIQDAVDAASAGDLVLVTNGVYETGGRPAPGEILTNRVLVTNAITLQSVNGAAVTTISGYQVATNLNGDTAVRCVHLAEGSTLSGFTLANGATRRITNSLASNEYHGGGVWCQSTNVTVSGCIIVSNCCAYYGGGAYSGHLSGCQINYNQAYRSSFGNGGGVAYSVVSDSTIRSNALVNAGGSDACAGALSCVVSNSVFEGNSQAAASACSLYGCAILNNTNMYDGGGVRQSFLDHCTVSGNGTLQHGGGAFDCTLNNCVISSNRARYWGGGVYSDTFHTNTLGQNNLVCGNSTAGPGAGVYLQGINRGLRTNLVNWMIVSNSAGGDGGGLYLANSTMQVDSCTFTGNSSPGNGGGFCPSAGLMVISNSTFAGNIALGDGGGAYNAWLTNCTLLGNQATNGGGLFGMATNCVFTDNVASGNGGGLYCTDTHALVPGCGFTNNAAANGGGAYLGNFTNCVFVANSAVTNGGAAYTATFNHCLVISNQAAFGGGLFQGSLLLYYPSLPFTYLDCSFVGNSARSDGGALFSVGSATAGTNCVVAGNSAANNGGGLVGGSCSRATLSGNVAGANGGGAFNVNLTLSVLSNNVAGATGGGVYYCNVGNSLITGNAAANGGGACASPLNNSTIVSNQATLAGGGVYFPSGGSVNSCIIYDNAAPSGPNYAGDGTYLYCCTTPLLSGGNHNLDSDPSFVSPATGNYRLQTNSPCINAGVSYQYSSTDLDGRPRKVGGTIDIGAYEFQGPGVGEFIPWLQQYGLPISGSADYLDTDRDGFKNWQEWLAGTDPTNSTSVLKMLTPACVADGTGTVVSWQSVPNRTYFLQRSDDLLTPAAFSTIQSNIAGQFGTTSYTDTNAPGAAAGFYRVGIQ